MIASVQSVEKALLTLGSRSLPTEWGCSTSECALGRQGPGSLNGFFGAWVFRNVGSLLGLASVLFQKNILLFLALPPTPHLLSVRRTQFLLKGLSVLLHLSHLCLLCVFYSPWSYSHYHPTSCSLFLIPADFMKP